MKLSTNKRITPDISKQLSASMVDGWEPIVIPLEEQPLLDFVRSSAYCTSTFADGFKLKTSVMHCNNIILDFDRGRPTYDEMVETMSKWDFTAFLHTTRSHQKGDAPVDKFRVIIPLKEPISQFELESIKNYPELLTKLSGGYRGYIDMSTFQASRLYVAAPDAIGYLHIPEEKDSTGPKLVSWRELVSNQRRANTAPQATQAYAGPTSESKIKQAETKAPSTAPASYIEYNPKDGLLLSDNTIHTITSKTNIKLPAKLVLKLSNGAQVPLASITAHTSVFCPFCDPAKRGNPHSANAFIDVNSFGMKYLFCSSENKTYWQEATEDQLAYALTKSKELIIFRDKTTGFLMYADRDPKNKGWRTIKISSNDYWLHLCVQHNLPADSKFKLPIVDLSFDPEQPQGMNLKTGEYNTFEPTEYYKSHQDGTWATLFDNVSLDYTPEFLKLNCPTIYFIMYNILGSDNNITLMINWLSSIFKEKVHKVDTYWVIISEEQGVGKDLFFSRVLEPLFGPAPQTSIMPPDSLVSGFNALDQQCWLRGYNEVFSGSKLENKKIRNIIKEKVTQKLSSITFKGADTFQTKTCTNYIFFSNNFDAVELDKDDRRAIVVTNTKGVRIANTQLFKDLGKLKYEALIASEIPEFARLIFTLEHDYALSMQAPSSDIKRSLIKLSESPHERLATALRLKDYTYIPITECFPLKPGEELTAKYATPEGEPISEQAHECISAIRRHGAIPAKFMKQIATELWGSKTPYHDSLVKLEVAGVISATIKLEGIPTKSYVYKEKK